MSALGSKARHSVKGRILVASSALPAGSLVLRNEAFLRHPRFTKKETVCLQCALRIKPENLDWSCQQCRLSFCSEDCQSRGRPVHEIECAILPHLPKIAKCQDCTSTCLWTPLRFVVTRFLDQSETRRKAEEKFLALEAHSSKHSSDYLISFYKAASQLLHLLPAEVAQQTSPEELVLVHCIDAVNCFCLGWCDSGVGLFLEGSYFSHSCVPNCAYMTHDGSLTVYSIQPIREGSELTISYVDLCQPTIWRHRELYSSKFFVCGCSRCRSSSENGRMVTAVRCLVCDQGYMLPDPPCYPPSQTPSRGHSIQKGHNAFIKSTSQQTGPRLPRPASQNWKRDPVEGQMQPDGFTNLHEDAKECVMAAAACSIAGTEMGGGAKPLECSPAASFHGAEPSHEPSIVARYDISQDRASEEAKEPVCRICRSGTSPRHSSEGSWDASPDMLSRPIVSGSPVASSRRQSKCSAEVCEELAKVAIGSRHSSQSMPRNANASEGSSASSTIKASDPVAILSNSFQDDPMAPVTRGRPIADEHDQDKARDSHVGCGACGVNDVRAVDNDRARDSHMQADANGAQRLQSDNKDEDEEEISYSPLWRCDTCKAEREDSVLRLWVLRPADGQICNAERMFSWDARRALKELERVVEFLRRSVHLNHHLLWRAYDQLMAFASRAGDMDLYIKNTHRILVMYESLFPGLDEAKAEYYHSLGTAYRTLSETSADIATKTEYQNNAKDAFSKFLQQYPESVRAFSPDVADVILLLHQWEATTGATAAKCTPG